MDKIKIGKQLKELRRSRGWRQLEVAEKVGLSRSANGARWYEGPKSNA